MDVYATTIRNLSCHKLSIAGVRKQYALLAPVQAQVWNEEVGILVV